MALVKMYKATDGSLHETFEAYSAHEQNLKIEKACREATFDLDSFFASDDLGGSVKVLSEGDIGNFVADNADLLRNILNNSVVTRRGRKGTK